MKELRLEQAVEAYRREKVTLSRAAEIAGVEQWDFIARMKDQNLELHYDTGDFEADIKAVARKS